MLQMGKVYKLPGSSKRTAYAALYCTKQLIDSMKLIKSSQHQFRGEKGSESLHLHMSKRDSMKRIGEMIQDMKNASIELHSTGNTTFEDAVGEAEFEYVLMAEHVDEKAVCSLLCDILMCILYDFPRYRLQTCTHRDLWVELIGCFALQVFT